MTQDNTRKSGNRERNILIVDDAQDNIELLFGLLAGNGYQVRAAINGRAALKAVQKKLPDLILLDIRMPEMDGYEVCRRLKYDRISARIPVIFISGLEDSKDKVRGFDAGGVDYITKPFQPEEVLARVRTQMTLTRMKQNLEEMVAQRTSELTRLASAVEQINEEIAILDADTRILYVNPAFEGMTGLDRDDILTKPYQAYDQTCYAAPSFEDLIRDAGQGRAWSGRQTVSGKEGSKREVHTTLSPIFDRDRDLLGFVFVRRDITEMNRVERMLRQAQKMEAIGTLAGGIAHDFNNILFAILGHAELSLEPAQDLPDVHSSLTQIYQSATRAKELVHQILSFSRQNEQEKYAVKIIPVIKEVAKFLSASLPSTIRIDTLLNTRQDLILADPTQIHQILMNLCTNAAHAMNDTGGTISISLDKIGRGSPELAPFTHAGKSEFIRLAVRDTGCGIPAELLDAIFDPYFTTKEQGEGTGLGLSVVHGIVKGADGHIDVVSQINKGTTFFVYFPLLKDKSKRPKPLPLETESPVGTERVLLVDDEASIVRMGKRLLGNLGYTVEGVCDPREALALVRDETNHFDLVITDKTMPGMTGFTLAEEVKKISRGMPVILCTGYREKGVREKVRALGIEGLMDKPMNLVNMARTVRNVLDNRFNGGQDASGAKN